MGIYIIYYIIITISAIMLSRYLFYYSNATFYYTREKKWKKQKILLTIIAFGLLVLVVGLRSERNGLDLYNSLGTGYFYYYEKINEDSVLEILRNFGKRKYVRYGNGSAGQPLVFRLGLQHSSGKTPAAKRLHLR